MAEAVWAEIPVPEPLSQRAVEIFPELTRVCRTSEPHCGSSRFDELLGKMVSFFAKEKPFAANYRIIVDVHINRFS
jgi:hypothetical protein